VEPADPVLDAIEREFELLRRTDPPPGDAAGSLPPALDALVRWGLAIVPLVLGWGLFQAIYLANGNGTEDLGFRALGSLGVVGSIACLVRGSERARRGRRFVLARIGASTGVGLAAAPCVLLGLPFVQLLITALVIAWSEPRQATVGVLIALIALAPLAMLAVGLYDAIQSLRRVRTAPLTWHDSGWLLVGLFPGALAAKLALLSFAMFGAAAG
jgi:hypothetical protein